MGAPEHESKLLTTPKWFALEASFDSFLSFSLLSASGSIPEWGTAVRWVYANFDY